MSSHRHRKRGRRPFAADGPFAVECPGCRAHVAVARALVGRAAGCPACRVAFRVPAPELPEPALPQSFERRGRDVPVRAAADVATEIELPDAASVAPAASVRSAAAVEMGRRADEPLVFAEPPLPSTRRRPLEADLPIETPSSPATPGAVLATCDDPADGRSSPAPGPQAATAAPTPAPAATRELAFREPVKTVVSGGAEIELRRLTPEERRVRRARRNVLILVVGAEVLVALVVILGKGMR